MKKIYFFLLSAIFVLILFSAVVPKSAKADQFCGVGQTCPDGSDRRYRDVYDCHWNGAGICVDGWKYEWDTCQSRSSGCPGGLTYCCGFYYGNQVRSCNRNTCTYTTTTRFFDCCPGGGGGTPTPTPTPSCPNVTADIEANGSDGPVLAYITEPVALSWTSNNADSCSVTGGSVPGGTGGTSGSINITEPSVGSYTYTQSCSNSCGNNGSDTVTVDVKEPCVISVPNVVLNGLYDFQDIVVTISEQNGGLIDYVVFTSNPVVATVNPIQDDDPAFITRITATGISPSSPYSALATMDNGKTCSASATVTVNNPLAWWQSKEGNLRSIGDIISDISGSCTVDPLCDENLIIYDAQDFPGLPQAGGSIGTGSGGGGISQVYNWNSTGITYNGPAVVYAYLRNKLPSTVVPQAIGAVVNQLTLTSGGTEYPVGSGNFYYEYTGGSDLTIQDGDAVLDVGGRKTIVFAQNNVNILSEVRVTDGTGLFMLIASGDISVNPSVGGPQESPTPVPDLEGVYYAEGQILTGTKDLLTDLDDQLHFRGVVASWDKVIMQRHLPDNSIIPAEFFEFGADQYMAIPPDFGDRNVLWREVAP